MGCFCHNGNKQIAGNTMSDEKDDYLFINKKTTSAEIRPTTNPEPLIKKTVSITAGTFINEKKFKTFIEEYELMDFIGNGKY
jgi:hypothetical protein